MTATETRTDDLAAMGLALRGRRWFARDAGTEPSDGPAAGSPDEATETADVVSVASVPLGTRPAVSVAVIETTGGARYQLLRPGPAPQVTATKTTASGTASARPSAPSVLSTPPTEIDLGTDPVALGALGSFVATTSSATDPEAGTVLGHWLPDALPLGTGSTRLLGTEQSNTSVVVGGSHVLKIFRRLHEGPHPEVEVGRHLAGSGAPVAELAGWYELRSPDGAHTALGVVQELVSGALDGWALVLGALAADPGGLLTRLHELGAAIAVLHDALARPEPDAPPGLDAEAPEAFGTTPLGSTRLDAVVQGIAVDAARLLGRRDLGEDAAQLDPAAVARLARDLAGVVGQDLGAAIRHHGDLHLGQTVVGADGWVILDFEGEPNRPLAERRLRHSPLRDVAGMLRSLAYAVATHRRAGLARLSPGWEPAGRAALLDGYLSTVSPDLVPRSAVATTQLLALFELEKVVYEIGYELAHRPDWVHLPLAGLRTLLERPIPGGPVS